MFTKLKNAFLGRNTKCMSKKAQKELRRFVETEFRNDADFAEWMISTNQFQKLQDMQKCLNK